MNAHLWHSKAAGGEGLGASRVLKPCSPLQEHSGPWDVPGRFAFIRACEDPLEAALTPPSPIHKFISSACLSALRASVHPTPGPSVATVTVEMGTIPPARGWGRSQPRGSDFWGPSPAPWLHT